MIVVAAALINDGNAILIQQRPNGKTQSGLWEFPGGKVERYEDCRSALARELAEELRVTVNPFELEECTFVTGRTAEGTDLVLLLYVCRFWSGAPQAVEADALAWVGPSELLDYALMPLDVPLAERLAKFLSV